MINSQLIIILSIGILSLFVLSAEVSSIGMTSAFGQTSSGYSSSGKISVSGTDTYVTYSITEAKILDIIPHVDAISLIISIDATSDGSLTITIPRSMLDATINGIDDKFFILVNGEETNYDEITSYSDRTLTISFPLKAKEIEIIGTKINITQINLPTIEFNSQQYYPGDIFEVIVIDSSANKNPNQIETVSIITFDITSKTTITPNAKETGTDTGIFVYSSQLPNVILQSASIAAIYDYYGPSGWDQITTQTEINPGGFFVNLGWDFSYFDFKDMNGNSILVTGPQAGEPFVINMKIKNMERDDSSPFDIRVILRDENNKITFSNDFGKYSVHAGKTDLFGFQIPAIPEGRYMGEFIIDPNNVVVETTKLDNTRTSAVSVYAKSGASPSILTDKSSYDIGTDAIITLTYPPLDTTSNVDKINAKQILVYYKGEQTTIADSVFDASSSYITETGGSTGLFQIVINIPQKIGSTTLQDGDHISLWFVDNGINITNVIFSVNSQIISPTDTIPPKLLVQDIELTAKIKTGMNVDFTNNVKAIDNVDGIIKATCTPDSNSFFKVGKTNVKCSATDSSGNTSSETFTVTIHSSAVSIPSWVKVLAGFWCNGDINNENFIDGIEYLIENKIIIISSSNPSSQSSSTIPEWIKNNACWWSQDKISDNDFVTGIEYLVNNGIIVIFDVVNNDNPFPSSATIGPNEGATISSPDGVLILKFEPNSVNTSRTVSIEMGSNSDIPWLNDKDEKFESIYRLEPDGIQFKIPVKFSMLYDLKTITILNEDLTISKIPILISNGKPTIIENTKLVTNLSEKTLELKGEINHFSAMTSSDFFIKLTLDPSTEHRLFGDQFLASLEIGFDSIIIEATLDESIDGVIPISDGSVLVRQNRDTAFAGEKQRTFTYVCFDDGPGHYGAKVMYTMDIRKTIQQLNDYYQATSLVTGPGTPVSFAIGQLIGQLNGLLQHGIESFSFDHDILGYAECDPPKNIDDEIGGFEQEHTVRPPIRAWGDVSILEPIEGQKVALYTPWEVKYEISKPSLSLINSLDVEFIPDDSAITFPSAKTTETFSPKEEIKTLKTTAECSQLGKHSFSIKIKIVPLAGITDDRSVNCVSADEIKEKLPIQKNFGINLPSFIPKGDVSRPVGAGIKSNWDLVFSVVNKESSIKQNLSLMTTFDSPIASCILHNSSLHATNFMLDKWGYDVFTYVCTCNSPGETDYHVKLNLISKQIDNVDRHLQCTATDDVGDDIPEPDRDGDGIPDAKDACPYEAEDMDGVEDSDGCPE